MVVDRGWWIEKRGISALMGIELQFGSIKISADDNGDGCITLFMYLMSLYT